MFRGNFSRTGQYETKAIQNSIREEWSFATKGPVLAAPVVMDDRLYVGSGDHHVYALDRAHGKELWKFGTQGRIIGTPIATEDALFVTSGDGSVFRLEREGGKELWRFGTGHTIEAAPLLFHDVLYVGSLDGFFYAIDANSGMLLWKVRCAGVRTSAALDGSSLYFSDQSGTVFSVDWEGKSHDKVGRIRWKRSLRSSMVSMPIVSLEHVLCTDAQGRLHVLDRETGDSAKVHPVTHAMSGAPSLAEGVIVCAGHDGYLRALDASTYVMRWKKRLQGRATLAPIVAESIVMIVTSSGVVEGVDLATGQARWMYSVGARITSPPTIRQGRLYLGCMDGRVVALGDRQAWRMEPLTKADHDRWKKEQEVPPPPVPSVITSAAEEAPLVSVRPLRDSWKTYPRTRVEVGKNQSISFPFSTFRGNLENTGMGPTREVRFGKQWTFDTAGRIDGSVSIYGQTAYVGSFDGCVYAVDVESGKLQWKFEALDQVDSTPAVTQDFVYVGCNDGSLLALHRLTGALVWWFQTGLDLRSSPTVYAGRVIVGSWDDHIYAVDTHSGKLHWKFQTEHGVSASPCIVGENVCLGSWDGTMYCLRASDGHLEWKHQSNAPIISSACSIAKYDLVCFGNNAGAVIALNAKVGSLVWKQKRSNAVKSSPAYDSKLEQLYVAGDDGSLVAYDVECGTEVWKESRGSAIFSSPVIGQFHVLVVNENDQLLALSRETGSVDWELKLKAPVNASITLHEGRAFFGDTSGVLHAIGEGGLQKPSRPWTRPESELSSESSRKEVVSSTKKEEPKEKEKTADILPFPTQKMASSLRDSRRRAMNFSFSSYGTMERGDFCRRGQFLTQPFAHEDRLVWETKTDAGFDASPTLHEGVLYCGDMDGNLRALKQSDGAEIWSQKGSSGISSAPVVANHFVYTTTVSGVVRARRLKQGSHVWEYDTGGGSALSAPIIAQGVMVVAGESGFVVGLDAERGEFLWSTVLGGAIQGGAAIYQEHAYIGTSEQSVFALDLYTGDIVWSCSVEGAVTTCPAIDDKWVCVTTRDGFVSVLDAETGHLVWSLDFKEPLLSSPALRNGSVYAIHEKGTLGCFNLFDPFEYWRQEVGKAKASASPIVAGDVVFVALEDGTVRAYNQSSGKLMYAGQLGEGWNSTPWIANGVLYATKKEGGVVAVSVARGTEDFTLSPGWKGSGQRAKAGVAWSFQGGDAIELSTEAKEFSLDLEMGGEDVFWGGPDGLLYALNRWTGELTWKVDLQARVTQKPCTSADHVFAVTGAKIHSFKRGLGEFVWDLEMGAKITTEVVSARERILFGCENGSLYSVNRLDRRIRWWFRTGGYVQTPVVVGMEAFFTASDGFLYAVDLESGELSWKKKIGEGLLGPVSAGPSLLVTQEGGRLFSINRRTEDVMWSCGTAGAIVCRPTFDHRYTYVGSMDSRMYAFDSNGQEKWRYQADAGITLAPRLFAQPTGRSFPSSENELLFFGTEKGTLYVLLASTGKLHKKFETGSELRGKIAGALSMSYFGTGDGRIFAYF